MNRGDFYRVKNASLHDPKKERVYVVVGRHSSIIGKYSTVICAPVYSAHHGISTQVEVGPAEGLKHASCIHCDNLMSLPKSLLTDYLGCMSSEKIPVLNRALGEALGLI